MDFRNKVAQAREDIERLQAAQVAQGKDFWVEVYDPSSDAFYYYSSTSGASTWDKPEEYIMAADDELMNAVIKIQCLFRARQARLEMHRRTSTTF